MAETQKNNFTEFSTLADTHSKQIDELTVQGAKIESFLEEIVSVIKQNDENSLKLTESLERYKRDILCHKKELQEIVTDLETRYGYFHSSVSTDIAGVMKAQREASGSIEKFVATIDQRLDLVEETVDQRLEAF